MTVFNLLTSLLLAPMNATIIIFGCVALLFLSLLSVYAIIQDHKKIEQRKKLLRDTEILLDDLEKKLGKSGETIKSLKSYKLISKFENKQ